MFIRYESVLVSPSHRGACSASHRRRLHRRLNHLDSSLTSVRVVNVNQDVFRTEAVPPRVGEAHRSRERERDLDDTLHDEIDRIG